MTNYIKTAYDQLIAYIKTQYPRFIDPERIQLGAMTDGELIINKSALGYEDCLVFYMDDDAEDTVMVLTSGAEHAEYNLKMIYYKPGLVDDVLDSISDFAEDLKNFFVGTYQHVDGKWINLGVSVSYDPPIPEDYKGRLFGFEFVFNFSVGKY